jgi:ribosomal protein S18 acetylase RimI-like enzyme
MIRILNANDFEIWKQLRIDAVKNQPQSFGESYEEVAAQNYEYFCESIKNGTLFGYEISSKVVGVVGIYGLKHGNMRHRGTLFGLYVAPEHRRKKIAQQLVKHALADAAQCYRMLHLAVSTENVAAISLYKKFGFEIYATEPEAILIVTFMV